FPSSGVRQTTTVKIDATELTSRQSAHNILDSDNHNEDDPLPTIPGQGRKRLRNSEMKKCSVTTVNLIKKPRAEYSYSFGKSNEIILSQWGHISITSIAFRKVKKVVQLQETEERCSIWSNLHLEERSGRYT